MPTFVSHSAPAHLSPTERAGVNPVIGVRVITDLLQIAIDPQAGFMPVRVVKSFQMSMPVRKIDLPMAPQWEVHSRHHFVAVGSKRRDGGGAMLAPSLTNAYS